MRCLIYARSAEAEWLKEYFPDLEPFLLKIVNKSLLEYSIDLATLLGCNELRIATDSSIKSLESCIGNGNKWSAQISYMLARPGDSLKNVYLKNYSFCKDTDLLILNGFFFAQYDRSSIKDSVSFDSAFCCGSEKRIIFVPQNKKLSDTCAEESIQNPCLSPYEITNIMDYYQLSMSILGQFNKHYVLPGYTNERDAFLGINLVYPHNCHLYPPIMIGNNVRFQRNTTVGPNSVIGNNVIIDENTIVNDSIIYDNTYIGRDLELKQKIVYKGNLISASTGESILINDNVLVAEVELGIVTSYLNRIVQRVIALALFLIQLPLCIVLFLPYRLFYWDLRSERLLNRNLKRRKYLDAHKMSRSWWGRLLVRLSLDKTDQLFSSAFHSKLYLVGNRLYPNTVQYRKLIRELPVYNPGVFSLAESMNADNPEIEGFYELEYIDRISTIMNLKVLFRFLANRLVYGLSKPQMKADGES